MVHKKTFSNDMFENIEIHKNIHMYTHIPPKCLYRCLGRYEEVDSPLRINRKGTYARPESPNEDHYPTVKIIIYYFPTGT